MSFFYADPQPTEVDVPVHYLNSEGEPVAMDDTLTLGEGPHLVTANPQGMADGYVPMPGTESTVEVNVSGGIATPSEVYFYYYIPETEAPATEAPTDTPCADGHALPADDAGGDSLLRHERRGNCRPGGEGTAAGDVPDDSGARNPRLRAGRYLDAV